MKVTSEAEHLNLSSTFIHKGWNCMYMHDDILSRKGVSKVAFNAEATSPSHTIAMASSKLEHFVLHFVKKLKARFNVSMKYEHHSLL